MRSDQVLTALFIVSHLIIWGLTCYIASRLGLVAFQREGSGAATQYRQLLSKSGILEILTVVMIPYVVSFLALTGKLNSEAVASLFSGVAGYVLGNRSKEQDVLPQTDREVKSLDT